MVWLPYNNEIRVMWNLKKLVLLRFGEIKWKIEQKPRIKKNINGNLSVNSENGKGKWINGERMYNIQTYSNEWWIGIRSNVWLKYKCRI